MAETVLGADYELSLVFIGSTRSRALNKQHRGKDRPTNILSFPLEEEAGEIYIALRLAESEASKFNMKPRSFVAYLFLHGLLHLKGYDHGSTMERKEDVLLQRFGFERPS